MQRQEGSLENQNAEMQSCVSVRSFEEENRNDRKFFTVDYSVEPSLPIKASFYRSPHLRGEVEINLEKIRLKPLRLGTDINTILRTMNGCLEQGRFLDQLAAEKYIELCNQSIIDPITGPDEIPLRSSTRLFWSGTVHNNGHGRLIPVTFMREREWRKRFYHSSENIPPNSFLVFLVE